MFNYDNPVFWFINKIADVIFVSIFWLIFSIPVVTLGASTSALYYCVHKVIKGGREYLWRSFWKEFKNDLKGSILCTIVLEVIFGALLYPALLARNILLNNPGDALGTSFYFFYVMMCVVVLWAIYVFCSRARFSMSWGASLVNGLKLFVSNLLWALIILAGLAVCAIAVANLPFLILVVPALEALLCDLCMERMFRRLMTDEEKVREEEKDRRYYGG